MRRETILLVEDAPSLRGLIRRLLDESGYKVIDTGDPAEALRMADEHPGPLPLMIADLTLPGFGGAVLAERMAAARPETRVLYTSGRADELTGPAATPGPYHAFLRKPFTGEELLAKVRQLLGSEPEPRIQPSAPAIRASEG